MTKVHEQVQVQVQAQAQAQAQGAIEDTMQVCVKNHERVVTVLKEKNLLGARAV